MNETELDQLLNKWQAPEPAPALRRQLRAAFPADPRRRLFGVPVRWIVAFAASAGAVAIGTGLVGNGSMSTFWGSTDLAGGTVYVQATQMVDPPLAQLKWWTKGSASSVGQKDGAVTGSNAMHDRSAKLFYGYDYVAEPLGGGQYRVTVKPLQAADIHNGPFVVTAQIAPLPEMPAPRIVAEGQAFDIDLYRSRGERVFSRLQLSAKPFSNSHQPKPEQQAQTLTMEDPQLYKNGSLVASDEGGGATGATLWFRLPGLGRYLATLDPARNPAFVKAGTASGNALEFQAGGDDYRIVSSKPMVASGSRDIYVYHDQQFESQVKPDHQETMFGSAGPACIFNGACTPK
jgi:hypothetical protein